MNIFMFSSFVSDGKVKKIIKKLPHETIAYIPAYYDAPTSFYGNPGYYELGFRRGMSFPLGRNYDERREKLLFSCDAIHIGGGNTFELLFMLRYRGLLPKLKKYVENGGILMGSSAGSIVMCPDISIAQFADDNWLHLSGEELEGLSLVDFYMKPHWEQWAHKKRIFHDFSKEHGKPVYGVREFQAIYVHDGEVDFINGPPKRFIS